MKDKKEIIEKLKQFSVYDTSEEFFELINDLEEALKLQEEEFENWKREIKEKLKEWKWEEKKITSKGMPLIEGQIINDFYNYINKIFGEKN